MRFIRFLNVSMELRSMRRVDWVLILSVIFSQGTVDFYRYSYKNLLVAVYSGNSLVTCYLV